MAIYKRGGVWWLDIYVGKPMRRMRKSLKTTDENKARMMEQTFASAGRGTTARKQAMQILDAVLPPEHAGMPLDAICEFYFSCVGDENISLTERTAKQRRNVLVAFVEWAKRESRATTAADINTDIAFRYSQRLGELNLLGKTRNSYIGELSTVWKMLMKRSKVDANPWSGVRVQRDRENEHSGRAFTPDEIARLLKTARAVGHDWEGMIVVGLYTGLRMPDVTTLRWTDCDMKTRTIRLAPSKTKRHGIEVAIPMHPKVHALLTALARARVRNNNNEYVFPWRAAHPAAYKARGEDKTFADILALAEVKPRSDRDKLSFHCLRHTFISRLAEAGVAEDVRMRLAGHSNADTHAIYTHDDVSGRKAIEALA